MVLVLEPMYEYFPQENSYFPWMCLTILIYIFGTAATIRIIVSFCNSVFERLDRRHAFLR